MLLNQNNIKVHESPEVLGPLLLLAASEGHTDIVIEHGAPIETQNAQSETSLTVAAAAGHGPMVELLQRGANVKSNNGNQNARLRAIENRHWEIVSVFLGFELREGVYDIESVFHSGIEDDEPKLVELLIGKGLSPTLSFPTHKPSDGHNSGTVLTWAARGGHATLVQVLIDNGADINLQDDAGCTPLVRAAEFNHKGTVTLLIACGAEINFPFNNYTPLQIASIRGNRDQGASTQAWREVDPFD